MDKTTLGSSAILGIQSVSFFLIKTSLILTSTHPTEHPHIWPLTSEIQMILTSCLAMLLTSTPHSDTTGARFFFLIRLWNPSFKFIRIHWKARHNLLLELLDFRVPPESLSPTFPCRKMDEVWLHVYNKKQFHNGQLMHIFIFKTSFFIYPALTFWYGQSPFAHTQLARILQASSLSVWSWACVKVQLRLVFWLLAPCFTLETSKPGGLVTGVSRCFYFFLPLKMMRWDWLHWFVSFDERHWCGEYFLLYSSSLSLPCSSDYFRLYQLRDSPYQHRRI